MNDIASARIVIRVYPADFDGSDDSRVRTVGEFALDGRDLTIGRGSGCDIIFDGDTLTSRRHAMLRREADHYYIGDLGSSNGTFVNDHEVRAPTALMHGDRIQIGQHELLFLVGSPQPIPPVEELAETKERQIAPAPDAAPVEESALVEPAPVDQASAPGEGSSESQQRLTAAPAPAQPTAKYASVARLSNDLTESASRMISPAQSAAELDEIRAKLLEATEALNRQANAQAMLTERRRAALIDIRDRAAALIADLRREDLGPQLSNATESATTEDLVALAERVADDPNDLTRLRQLSAQAGAIAQALRAQEPTEGAWTHERQRVLQALEDMHSIAKNRN